MSRVVRKAAVGGDAVPLSTRAVSPRELGLSHEEPEPEPAVPVMPLAQAEQERRRAYEEGRAAGRAEADADLAQVLQLCRRVVDELRASRTAMVEDWEGRLQRAAVAIAETILRRELRTDREQVARSVREVLARITSGQEVEVRAHPDDAEQLEATLCAPDSPAHVALRVVGDAQVEPGGALIWWGDRGWDTQPSRQLEWLGELLERWSLQDDERRAA
ncbi:MAG: hypothetical protein GF355_18050 [Candidatus Eisenbacteria bacterium]|nr:hypothetical protein [Candidatus Eisenbacteria bacterium]